MPEGMDRLHYGPHLLIATCRINHPFPKYVSIAFRPIVENTARNWYSILHEPQDLFVPPVKASLLTTSVRPQRHTTFQCERRCLCSVEAARDVTVNTPNCMFVNSTSVP